MENKKNLRWEKYLNPLALVAIFTQLVSPASAAILFQDDTFQTFDSPSIRLDNDGAGAANTSIQFGNDSTGSENGVVQWNISTNKFSVDHTIDITGGLTTTGATSFASATQFRLRESSNPTTSAACTNTGELIVNTTSSRIEICTATGSAGAATWVVLPAADATTLDTLDSTQFLRSDTTDNYTSGTLTLDAGTTLDVNGAADYAGSTQFLIRSATSAPATCSEGELFYNSTSNVLFACTATNTWTAAGPVDFENVYAKDADQTLTTSAGNYTINAGAGTFAVTNTAGVIDFDSATFTLDTTSTFSVDGVGASNVTTASGNLTLSTTTSGNVLATAADDVSITAGDDVLFDDAQLSTAIQLTNTATAFNATLTAGGIIDNINSFALTTAGEGASNVGLEASSLTNVSPASNTVQAALAALDAKVGAGASNNVDLTFYPEFPDSVIFRDGSTNLGTLETTYDDTNDEHYYRWTTTQSSTQDIDIKFRFPLPPDFTDVNNFTFKFRTGSTTEADNDVEVSVYNATDETATAPTLCGADTTNGNTSWTTATITEATLETGCTGSTALSAGDIIEVDVKLLDNTGAEDFADIGIMALGYDN